ncbi:MAG: helix-turn-helix transcriptional regulator [Parvularculales bacterium]
MKKEMTFTAVLGLMLRNMCKDKGLDQAQMAKKMGMNRSSWSRIENGITAVDIQQLKKIGEILGVDATVILERAEAVAQSLEDKGYTVHFDTTKTVEEKSKAKGIALVGGAVLGLLVGGILLSMTKDNEDDKSSS